MNLVELYSIYKAKKEKEPWLYEPDRKDFIANGFRCLIIRHEDLKNLNGYVAIPRNHPLYGQNYNNMDYLNVHGGITFSGIGGFPNFLSDGDSWWVGFDCAHAWDLCPFEYKTNGHSYGEYRTIEYVEQELIKLTSQIRSLYR